MKRFIFLKLAACSILLCLLACSGGGLSGGENTGGGPVGGPPEAGPGPGSQGVGQMAAGDGTLGSQSSNVDIAPTFFRQYDLHFKEESSNVGSGLYEYTLAPGQTAFSSAQVKRLVQGVPQANCSECEGRWIRVLSCGPHSDADIEKLISPEKKDSVAASNRLLWFFLHIPNPNDPDSNICDGAKYRDFPVKTGGLVDLSALEVKPFDIFVFWQLDEAPNAQAGELAISQLTPITKSQIVATEQLKSGLVRDVRVLSSPLLQLNVYQVTP